MNNQRPVEGDSIAERTMSRVSQHELDQLVDGDLEPAERRRLLTALADQPDGWRRCALTFLEAQSWRKACRQLAAESNRPDSAAPRFAQSLLRRHKLRVAASIAAAAALALMFFGGLATGRAWPIAPPQIAGENSSPKPTDAAGPAQVNGADANRKEGRMVVHVLGFINVQGEDGARHVVPIVAVPGLKVDPPPRQPATLAGARRVAIPAELVSVVTRGPPAY
jgi:hypothetical protein